MNRTFTMTTEGVGFGGVNLGLETYNSARHDQLA
jgi:hypothetical protein